MLSWILKYIAITIVFITISFVLVKISFSDLWNKDILIGYYISKILARTKLNKSLSIIIEARRQVEERFGSINLVPNILVLGSRKVWNSGLMSKTSSTEDLGWCINEKMCIFNLFQLDNINKITEEINEVFCGKPFHSIIIQLDPDELQDRRMVFYKTHIQNIFQNILLDCPVFLMINTNSSTDLGTIIDKSKNLDFQIENFLDSYLEKIILNKESKEVQKTISEIKIIEEKIQNFIYNLMNVGLRGVFITDETCSNNSFLFNEIYSECSNTSFVQTFSQFQKFLRGLRKIFIFFASFMIASSIFLEYKSGVKMIESFKEYREIKNGGDKNMISKITKDLKTSHFLSSFLLEKENNQINKIQLDLMSMWQKDFLDVTKQVEKEIVDNPTKSRKFTIFKNNIYELLSILDAVSNWDYSVEKLHYIDLIRDRIYNEFNIFFDTFFENKLLLDCQRFKRLAEEILSEKTITREKVVRIYKLLNNIKLLTKPSYNSWWVEGLGDDYNQILKKIEGEKSLRGVYQNIILQQKQTMNKFKEHLLTNDSIIGSIVILKEGTIELSKQTETVLSEIQKINQIHSNMKIFEEPSNNKEFVLWDLNALEKLFEDIISIKKSIEKIEDAGVNLFMSRIVEGEVTANIFEKIVSCTKITQKEVVSIAKRSQNLKQAQILIEKIASLSNNQESTNKVKDFLKVQLYDIERDIMEEIERGTISCYKNLSRWDGEQNVCQFLFQSYPDEVSHVVQRLMRSFDSLYNDTLTNLMNILSYIPDTDVKMIKYLNNQIAGYNKGDKNHLSSLEGFLKSISSWEIKYRNPEKISAQSIEWFDFQMQSFKKSLVSNTNRVFLFESNNIYNKIVRFFNEKIAGKFPFGSKGSANISDVKFFLESYRDAKKRLGEDQLFLQQGPMKVYLAQLDSLLECFDVEGSKLLLNIQMIHSDVTTRNISKNCNLLLKCSFTSDMSNVEEIISTQFDLKKKFEVEFRIADSSNFIIVDRTPTTKDLVPLFNDDLDYFVDTEKYSVKLKFSGFYSVLKFINKFYYKRDGKDLILKIEIPIYNTKTKTSDFIVTFIRVKNMPDFPFVLPDVV